MKPVILASASPRRRELLGHILDGFDVEASNAEEALQQGHWSCAALEGAVAKACDIASKHHGSLVIGADTVIEFDGEALGKPEDIEDAVRMLMRLSGKVHAVSTGVCIRRMSDFTFCRFTETSRVHFKPFDEIVARGYASKVHVLDKAGAYALQEHGGMIVDRVEGDADNVIGLPVARLSEAFKACGIRIR